MDLESLSYVPARFEEAQTIDAERSHTRYSKIVVHSARVRTQRRSKVWEDWARSAINGRSVTLIQGIAQEGAGAFQRIPAWYSLDRGLTKLSILPVQPDDASSIAVSVESIQVICPASDLVLFFDQASGKADDSEKSRAVLLQFATEDAGCNRICFLEETDAAAETFVQALTALWLEKRNSHSMWF